MLRRAVRNITWLALGAVVVGCTARMQPHSAVVQEPALHAAYAVMDDGYRLPVSVWRPRDRTRAVVLALHGFNDYRKAFDGAGRYFAERGIVTYAYDQRGFGETTHRGLWAGGERMAADLRAMVSLLRRRHPELPLYLLGESMGGAVAITAAADRDLPIDGIVLSAPAVWSAATMPWYQRVALRVAVRLVPGWRPTGETLGRLASDNLAMLRALRRDPLVIKRTRMDTVAGLVALMDAALAAAPRLRGRTLVLYGANDQLIPPLPTCRLLQQLSRTPGGDWRFAFYPDGYHMLLRDLQGERVLADVAHWLLTGGALPSGLTVTGDRWRRLLCA